MAAPVQSAPATGPDAHGQRRKQQMILLGRLVRGAALIVLLICIYSFLTGNGVFRGTFDNDAIAWYFLAKGIFCSLALYLLFKILEALPAAQ